MTVVELSNLASPSSFTKESDDSPLFPVTIPAFNHFIPIQSSYINLLFAWEKYIDVGEAENIQRRIYRFRYPKVRS
ncbi:hypothetical protein KY290_037926 [Solanum tuberosum]|uniref:Uncharacterized protein n=1 Tax=Solanum tuberosum TaxID=4113 RepID=A0ABQ7TXE1_SOLTU|nr:hypothetical protein KY289_037493 [Solanum tuberosum]KAH0640691.1 hypothetical protein KY285_037277 [Solanum tuberosum]KAH0739221.1 hypothetical protein KY290_037926 [Solanum tuberosum]